MNIINLTARRALRDTVAAVLFCSLVLGTVGYIQDVGSPHMGWKQLVAIPMLFASAFVLRRIKH